MGQITDDHLIKLVTGGLGSGKTTWVVGQVCESLMRGQKVISNVIFKWAAVAAYCKSKGVTVDPRQVVYFDTTDVLKNPNSLLDLLCADSVLVFDEAHLALAKGDHKDNAMRGGDFLSFLTQSRKLMVDIYFITQSEENLESKAVRMCTYNVRCRNWKQLPFVGPLLPFPITLAKFCDKDGKTVLARDWVWRPRFYKMFDTKQTFVGMKLGGQNTAVVRGKRKRVMGYGWRLMAFGSVLMAIGLYRYRRAVEAAEVLRAEETAEAERKALKAAQRPPNARPPGFGGAAGGSTFTASGLPASGPRVPVPLGLAEFTARMRFEYALPRYVSVRPFGIILTNGDKIRPGTPIADGEVRAWIEGAGTVTILTTSVIHPQLRLYKYGTSPLLCDASGGPLWAESRNSGGNVAGDSGPSASVVSAMIPPGTLAAPAAEVKGESYTAPPPFVPDVSDYRSVQPSTARRAREVPEGIP